MLPNDPKTPQVNPDISGHQELPPIDSFHTNDGLPSSPAIPVVKTHKNHPPLVPIVIAIIVGLVLIAAATVVYISTRKTPAPQTETPATSEVEKGKVSPEDIDTTNKSIDQNLNTTNDSSDFKTEDLLDSTLGL